MNKLKFSIRDKLSVIWEMAAGAAVRAAGWTVIQVKISILHICCSSVPAAVVFGTTLFDESQH